jgi:hypothetical protein
MFLRYACETLSLALGEEHRLRVLERKMLRVTCSPKTEETTGEECIMGNFIVGIPHYIFK